MASGGTLGEVPEFGHFVFFLPTKNPPCIIYHKGTSPLFLGIFDDIEVKVTYSMINHEFA